MWLAIRVWPVYALSGILGREMFGYWSDLGEEVR